MEGRPLTLGLRDSIHTRLALPLLHQTQVDSIEPTFEVD